jgi:hypothetical protein
MAGLRTQTVRAPRRQKTDATRVVHGPASGKDSGARAGLPAYLRASSLDAPRALDGRTRRTAEARLGVDLRDVRVHSGPESHAANTALGANAFAVGRDVVFADGRFNPDSRDGRQLLLHELTHVAQQRNASNSEPDAVSRPGDPSEREADRVARGAPASRDAVRERTPLRVACDGPTTTTPTTADKLEKTYHIKIIKGDEDWSESDLKTLSTTLGTLSGKERGIVSGYEFQRWTTPDGRAKVDSSYTKPTGTPECGLHELTLGGTTAKISMYDGCFNSTATQGGVPFAQFSILHEVGHAAEYVLARGARQKLDALQAKLDTANEKKEKTRLDYNAANATRNDLANEYNAASAARQKVLLPDVTAAVNRAKSLDTIAQGAEDAYNALKTQRDAAEKKYEAAEKAPADKFAALVDGKDALTPYSKKSSEEAFAEAFALYKSDPDGLKKKNLKLYQWFANNGEITE